MYDIYILRSAGKNITLIKTAEKLSQSFFFEFLQVDAVFIISYLNKQYCVLVSKKYSPSLGVTFRELVNLLKNTTPLAWTFWSKNSGDFKTLSIAARQYKPLKKEELLPEALPLAASAKVITKEQFYAIAAYFEGNLCSSEKIAGGCIRYYPTEDSCLNLFKEIAGRRVHVVYTTQSGVLRSGPQKFFNFGHFFSSIFICNNVEVTLNSDGQTVYKVLYIDVYE